jgi:catechol 2,3-dioxygenase-like lactoylglutathione lyase family enzyme
MLKTALACATVPTTDLERSARFYEETLGLTGSRLALDGGLYYEGGGGTMLHIYETKAATPGHTVAVFLVEDLDGVMAGLERRGVSFADVDDADAAAEDGGFRGAWFRDPDGNVVALRSY